jgi:hypothetical protein
MSAKVFQQSKLAGLVRRFEHDGLEPELLYKALRESGIQISILIKQPDSPGTFSRFDDELDCARIEPLLTTVDPGIKRLFVESPVMFLAEFHLHVESAAACRGDNLAGLKIAVSKTLAAFDSINADVRAKIQVRRKFSLGHSDFKGPATGYCGDTVFMGKFYFPPGGGFIGNQPTGHRDFEYRHQMETLLQMARDRRRIIAGVEWAGGR